MSRSLRASTVIGPLLIVVGISLGCDKAPDGPGGGLRPTALHVASVLPASGPVDAAVEVRVYGRGFKPGATVTLDGAAANVNVVSQSLIIATTPIHAAATVDVVVTNPGGESATLPGAFRYLPRVPAPLVVFSQAGFSTTDLRDAQDQILQLNTAGELIWTVDGTRIPGYAVETFTGVPYVTGRICPQGCAFEIRFGQQDGERRAYLTVDYGHDNPGTLVDVEVAAGALFVTQTSLYPPGMPVLSGTVTEMTEAGELPVDGAIVYRAMSSGWREATTNKDGFYSMPGVGSGTEVVEVHKNGYRTEKRSVAINGDTRLDVQLVRTVSEGR